MQTTKIIKKNVLLLSMLIITGGTTTRIAAAEQDYSNCARRMYRNIRQYIENARILVTYGTDPNAPDSLGNRPLITAARAGNIEEVRTLLNQGAHVNIMGRHSHETPLLVAITAGHMQVVRILLDHGASTTMLNADSDTPSITAAKTSQIEEVCALCSHDVACHFGYYTPLLWATYNGNVEVIRTLISHGANVNIASQFSETPLTVAASSGNVEAVRTLCSHRANLDIADRNGATPLILAADNGDVEVVRTLISHRANIDITNRWGNTALICAADKGHIAAVRTLINHNANVDIANQWGNTALIKATNAGHVEVVQTLIGRGAIIDFSILMLPNFSSIIQSTIELFRSQLAQQHPENLMEFLPSDLEQFGQNSEGTMLESMSNAFIQVGEIITRDMSSEDRNNFRTGCRLFRKAASNGTNIRARSKKTELFIKFITRLRQQLISLKEKNTGEEQIINAVEKVVALLDQELQQGHCICKKQKTQKIELVAQAAPAVTLMTQQPSGNGCQVAQAHTAQRLQAAQNGELVSQAATATCGTAATTGCAVAQQADFIAPATETSENRPGLIIAAQDTEYAQSLATDQRKSALEKQIAKLTQKTQAFMTEYDVHAAPLQIREDIRELYTQIVAARTELIGLIRTIQTFDIIFTQAKGKRLEKQSDALAHEQEQLAMIERAIDAYSPTPEEMRAARESFFLKKFDDDGKGKKPA